MGVMDARRRILLNTPHITTPASAGLVNFSTDMIAQLKSCKVYFAPVQSGTGDPSPTNVRPISGWDGVTVTRCGKNLFDKNTLSNVNNYEEKLGGYYYTKPIKLQPNTDYCIVPSSTSTLSTSTYYVLYINPSPNDPDYLESINNQFMYPVRAGLPNFVRFTTGPTGTIRFGVPSSGTAQALEAFMSIDWQLELGSTATTYAPYTGSTYPVSWQSEAGTIYGGTLDVTTGVLTVTHGNIVSYRGESLPGRWISSMDVYSAGGTPTTGAQVVYQLATPITYALTPQIIKSLRGVNNVWSNTNDIIDLSYWTH